MNFDQCCVTLLEGNCIQSSVRSFPKNIFFFFGFYLLMSSKFFWFFFFSFYWTFIIDCKKINLLFLRSKAAQKIKRKIISLHLFIYLFILLENFTFWFCIFWTVQTYLVVFFFLFFCFFVFFFEKRGLNNCLKKCFWLANCNNCIIIFVFKI